MSKLESCPRCGIEQDPEHPVCIHMAGRKGGRKLVATKGVKNFFNRWGRRGGAKTRDIMGLEFYNKIGKKGGDTVKATYGKDFYIELVAKKYGRPFFSSIGKKGGNRLRTLVAKGKATEILPEPECQMGYTRRQLHEILSEKYAVFMAWMNGQTQSICDGREYDPVSKTIVPSQCTPVAHGSIVYPHDLRRFLEGLPVID